MKNKTFSKGFTLIELLIVITIIGILAAALMPGILSGPARARDSARIADLGKISAAIETYNADQGKYPEGEMCVHAITELEKYFPGGKIPQDPSELDLPDCENGYYYCNLSSGNQNYIVVAKLERDEAAIGAVGDVSGLSCNGSDGTLSFTAASGGDGIYYILQ